MCGLYDTWHVFAPFLWLFNVPQKCVGSFGVSQATATVVASTANATEPADLTRIAWNFHTECKAGNSPCPTKHVKKHCLRYLDMGRNGGGSSTSVKNNGTFSSWQDARHACIALGLACWGVEDYGCDQGKLDIYLCAPTKNAETDIGLADKLEVSHMSCVFEKPRNLSTYIHLPALATTTIPTTTVELVEYKLLGKGYCKDNAGKGPRYYHKSNQTGIGCRGVCTALSAACVGYTFFGVSGKCRLFGSALPGNGTVAAALGEPLYGFLFGAGDGGSDTLSRGNKHPGFECHAKQPGASGMPPPSPSTPHHCGSHVLSA